MKNSFKTLLLSIISLGCITFGACASVPGGQTSKDGDNSGERSQGDANWVDYVYNSNVKLELDYVGRNFYTEGIGQFTLKTAIDGDTAHFTPVGFTGDTMKARFYGIDTPESTGKVQEYGKPASNFTKAKLYEANENGTIVVSSAQSTYGAPEPDSTGSRYVSLVWVNMTKKNAPMNELVLLNLWIVQEGLSWVKNVQSMPQYADTFYAAEQQARDYKLNLFSGKPDPLFNYGDYEDVSLLEIKDEIQQTLADPDHVNKYDGAKIRFYGTVAGFSNHILYLQDYVLYDNDDPSQGGEYCGINIFVGMGDIPTKYRTINTYVKVCGLAEDTENYGFQVTDTQGRFPTGSSTNENDAEVIYTPDQNSDTEHSLDKLEYTQAQLSAVASAKDPYNLECLNCYVIVKDELVCTRAFISDSKSKEVTLTFGENSFQAYIPFSYKPDPDNPLERWVSEDKFVNQRFSLRGVYVLHKTTSGNIRFQIVPNGASDLVWLGAAS